MSTQKLLAEAEKLLERGKTDEAIEKLKTCIASEPNNQLAVNRLATAYLDSGNQGKAVDTLAQFARRMATAGKPQVAVAIYKQALDMAPQDTTIILEFALRCEETGKLSEASTQGQKLIAHYLPRKRYFDALNIFPLLVRISPKDEKLKALWIESMRFGLAEMKLIHMLVAILGPPGLVSAEFQNGGDPSTVSAGVYSAIADLLNWFPRDPKLPYALAWGAYKRGDLKSAYRYLHETIRRDPDFTLGSLLFARILGENQKLNECLFVYKYVKERLNSDKQVDIQIITRQLEAFEQKNGWISFSEGDDLSAEQFKINFLSPQSVEEAEAAEQEAEAAEEAKAELPQPEIDLGLPSAGETPMEVELTGGLKKVTGSVEAPAPVAPSPTPAPVEAQPETETNKPLYQVKFTPAPGAAPAEPAQPTAAAPVKESLSPLDLIEQGKSNFGSHIEREEPTQIISRSDFPEQEERTEIISRESLKELAQASPASEPPPSEIAEEPQSLLDGMKDGADPVSDEPAIEEPTQIISLASIKSALATPEAETNIATDSGIVGAPLITSTEAPKPTVEFTAAPEVIDLGDDLLEGGTDAIDTKPEHERTQHLVEEIKKKVEEKPAEKPAEKPPEKPEEKKLLPEDFIKFAEGYLAKKNYYMARKSYRHALALGGDENAIKAKLREIRKLELPDSLYASASNDESTVESIETVVERLEKEFHLSTDERNEIKGSSTEIEALLNTHDDRTLMDLGVGFIEMGLIADAEKIFEKLSNAKDEVMARAAIYLLARAKHEGNDFGGAVGELKRLTRRPGITRTEKLSVYYALGEAFEKMRRKSESKKYFKKAAEIDANYRKLKDKLGEKDL